MTNIYKRKLSILATLKNVGFYEMKKKIPKEFPFYPKKEKKRKEEKSRLIKSVVYNPN